MTALAKHPPPSLLPHEEPPRPSPRTLLPFRAESTLFAGHPGVTLWYDGPYTLPDGTVKILPYHLDIGNPRADATREVVHPLGQCILRLMEMYWSLEASVDVTRKERDDLALARSSLQEEVTTLQHQLAEIQRRYEALVPPENGKNQARRGRKE